MKQSPESRARTNRLRIAKCKARYRYLREVLQLPWQQAVIGRNSVKRMIALVPGHEFPPELVARDKRGPAKGTKYRRAEDLEAGRHGDAGEPQTENVSAHETAPGDRLEET